MFQLNFLRYASAILLFSVVPGIFHQSSAVTIDVQPSIFSGRQDPIFSLSDSLSVALIKNRIGSYLVRSDLGDSGTPEPINTSGYRGISIMKSTESIGLDCFLSNGTAIFNFPQKDHRFFDYRSELQKMVLRFLKKELTTHPEVDSENIFGLIPDSLSKDYTQDGFFTIEKNNLFFNSGLYIDISQLGTGYQYLSRQQDTSSAFDIAISNSGNGGLLLKSNYGVAVVPTRLPGLPLVTSVHLDTLSTLSSTYKTVLFLAKLKPATLNYQNDITFDSTMETGHCSIVRTSEGGYAALVTAGSYIGGINRLHFYCYFSTNDNFSPSDTTVPNVKFSTTTSKNQQLPKRQTVNLKGQKIDSKKGISSQILSGKQIIVQ